MAGNDRGQATVELALALPVLCTLLLGVVQVAAVIGDQLAVDLAAREAARAASVAANGPAAARAAAERATPLRPLDVAVSTSAGAITVTVTHTDHTNTPLIGAFVADVTLRSSTTMALEPP
jgi:Flp pilus assembly protein TadG